MTKDGTSKDVAFARSTESIPFIEEYKYSLVASCYGNQEKPLGPYADLTFNLTMES